MGILGGPVPKGDLLLSLGGAEEEKSVGLGRLDNRSDGQAYFVVEVSPATAEGLQKDCCCAETGKEKKDDGFSRELESRKSESCKTPLSAGCRLKVS